MYWPGNINRHKPSAYGIIELPKTIAQQGDLCHVKYITDNGNSVSDFATKFTKRFHIGRLLFKCNAGKEKGIPVMDIFRYFFCMMFSGRSIYMQMKTGTFEGTFSKNTICRFLNDARVS